MKKSNIKILLFINLIIIVLMLSVVSLISIIWYLTETFGELKVTFFLFLFIVYGLLYNLIKNSNFIHLYKIKVEEEEKIKN